MRNALKYSAKFALAAVLAAAPAGASPAVSAAPSHAAPKDGGILKRPAVHNPDVVDFEADVPIVSSYELDAATAGTANPVDGGMDDEIDQIVKKVAPKHAAKPAPAKSARRPKPSRP